MQAAWARLVVGTVLSVGVGLGTALVAQAQPAPPTLPDPAPVMVDPGTTAYLGLDLNSAVCPPRPACIAAIPAVSRLLQRARDAGVFVVYSSTAGAQVLPDVAPGPDDPVVTSRADKFFNTDLDQQLKDHGIQTLVLVGSAANGAPSTRC